MWTSSGEVGWITGGAPAVGVFVLEPLLVEDMWTGVNGACSWREAMDG